MNKAISYGVNIKVISQFRHDLSKCADSLFLYNYRVEIENRNDFPIQLLSRYWRIVDSLNEIRTVEGPGVVGQQPTLQPGEVYTYTSSCDLYSEIGYMEGNYLFTKISSEEKFVVDIPKFDLIYPGRLN